MGLREKRKAATRSAIREAAMSLFEAQGYAHTTVEQIAQAAEISHTTFFRYFSSKEQVVMSDDLDEARDAALLAIAPGLGHFDLLRETVRVTANLAMNDPWVNDSRRMRLILSEPTLRTAFQLECDAGIAEVTDFFADYLGIPRDDEQLRVFVAAAGGVMFHIVEQVEGVIGEQVLDRVLAAVDLLERGLPLDGARSS